MVKKYGKDPIISLWLNTQWGTRIVFFFLFFLFHKTLFLLFCQLFDIKKSADILSSILRAVSVFSDDFYQILLRISLWNNRIIMKQISSINNVNTYAKNLQQKCLCYGGRDDISVQTLLEYSRLLSRQKLVDSHVEIKWCLKLFVIKLYSD